MKPNIIKWNNEYNESIWGWYIRPNSQPHSVICLVHGYGEHSMRYHSWAQKFVAEGFAFFAWDHAGHGQSDGKKGHIRSMQQFINEIEVAIDKCNEIIPGSPITLYGHSMGGNIALNYAIKKQEKIKLLIATSPWLELAKPVSPILRFAVKVLSATLPSITLKAPLDPKAITHVEEEAYKYANDALNHTRITPRLLHTITQKGQFAMHRACKIRLPALMLHGNADSITSFRSTSQTALTMEKCSFIPWNGMYHELHHETVRNEVFSIMVEWLNGNLDSFDIHE